MVSGVIGLSDEHAVNIITEQRMSSVAEMRMMKLTPVLESSSYMMKMVD
jgi:hypothetical protein